MKSFIVLLLSISSLCFSSNTQYCHLWDEEPHFIYYRVLAIETCIFEIKQALKDINANDAESVNKAIGEALSQLHQIEVLLGNYSIEE